MDQLRARAFLDILLGIDSRPLGSGPDSGTTRPDGGTGRDSDGGTGRDGDGGPALAAPARMAPARTRPGRFRPGRSGPDGCGPGEPRTPAPAGPLAGVIPPGFAGRANLTIPAATLLGLADRPGEMAGIGPLDPDLARDLAAAAARNPRSTWCVTVTDQDGHAIGHGCARPAPAAAGKPPKRHKPGTAGGPDPPGGPTFTFTPTGQPGPPGGYGTWRIATGVPGQRDLLLRSSPSPPANATTGTRPRATTPGSCSGT